jgi:hypothetical protein
MCWKVKSRQRHTPCWSRSAVEWASWVRRQAPVGRGGARAGGDGLTVYDGNRLLRWGMASRSTAVGEGPHVLVASCLWWGAAGGSSASTGTTAEAAGAAPRQGVQSRGQGHGPRSGSAWRRRCVREARGAGHGAREALEATSGGGGQGGGARWRGGGVGWRRRGAQGGGNGARELAAGGGRER